MNTLAAQETAAAKDAMKKCPKEANAVIKSLQPWLAAARTLDKAQAENFKPPRATDVAAQEKANAASQVHEDAARAMNDCVQ